LANFYRVITLSVVLRCCASAMYLSFVGSLVFHSKRMEKHDFFSMT
jgi:hypothetical protein